MPSFAAQQSLFRAYDIRGPRQHFTTDFIQALGHAFAHLYQTAEYRDTSADIDALANVERSNISQSNTDQHSINQQHILPNTINNTNKQSIVVIGYDVRCSSDDIAHTLATILAQHGLHVIQLGLVTTPMMAYWAAQYQGHGIMVTASHSAKNILGIKWLVNHQSPSCAEIQALYQQLAPPDTPLALTAAIGSMGHLPTEQVSHGYIDAIYHVFIQLYPLHPISLYPISGEQACDKASHHHGQYSAAQQPCSDWRHAAPKLELTVVIDCMHGATSHIAQPLFQRFCQSVIMLNNTADGHFPLGNPDPTEPSRLKQLQQAVTTHKADIGLAFDGDGDRLMVVDENGKTVMPDHLLYLLAKSALCDSAPNPASTAVPQVLFDIKCSHHLPALLAELGAEPIVSRTGSSLMRQQMQHTDSRIVFAGELSGHFIFNDKHFIAYDDAMYAALRLLHGLAAQPDDVTQTSLAAITQSLPTLVSTADHYLPIPYALTRERSIVTQLQVFCQYIQQLMDAAREQSDIADSQEDCLVNPACSHAVVNERSSCNCIAQQPAITLAQARQLLPIGTRLSCIDGVRLDFAHGFGVLRQSNTSHHLTARFAGDSLDDLKEVQNRFAALCRPFDQRLAEQIIAIAAE
ncbi:phosphomannomutase [Psychrobacter halodurans]|uniref:phosphomannomutase n=1 Tax=Psychrobacter halodurans TaxID=2818439 RepID=A0AAW4IMQ9_9GAMM|nr:phosphomannomutase [Psychrobacter halodurans]MBO1516709.1 phosphomannomutase [Psychrobacter halodurans]